jgi:hypothetical protein
MDEDIRPVLFAIVNDSFEAKKTLRFNAGLQVKSLVASDVATAIDAQIQRINQVNELMMAKIIDAANAITQTKSESTDEQKQSALRREIIETYANFMAKDQQEMADDEARVSWFIGQVN